MRASAILIFAIIACGEPAAPPAARNGGLKQPAAPRTAEHPLFVHPPKPERDAPLRDPAVAPRLIASPPPEYTPEARRQRIQGTVLLELVVERDGRVSGGRVLKPLPSGLTQKAIDAVERWRYAPARDTRGKPVRALVTARVQFAL